jgi:hypothetical protein
MARGWESKHVESQQEEARGARVETGVREPGAFDERRALELARADVAARVGRVPDGPPRRALEQALADLYRRLADAAPGS